MLDGTNGRLVVIGVDAGAKPELNLLALMSKRASTMASTLRVRPLEEKALTRALEREVLPLFERGQCTVPKATTSLRSMISPPPQELRTAASSQADCRAVVR